MVNKLSQLKKWLIEKRHFRTAWFAKDPQLTPEPEEALTLLPDDLGQKLKAALNDLPIVAEEKQTILEQLNEEISNWRKNPHLANNSMVVLSHPVNSVARILTESLMELRCQQDEPLEAMILDWIERPPDITEVKEELRKKLDWDEDRFPDDAGLIPSAGNLQNRSTSDDDSRENNDEDSSSSNRSKTRKVLAVIPNLSWCFLRSAAGLEGIDYLQDTLLSDRKQFWTIGCGRVSWEYLKSTLKFHAYCGKTIHLPALNGPQLQTWLAPVIEKFDICFSDAALHKRLKDPDSFVDMNLSMDKPIEAISEITQEVSATVQSSMRAVRNEVFFSEKAEEDYNACSDYFDRLADISEGVSVVALQLFVKSLRYRQITQEEKDRDDISRCHPEAKVENNDAKSDAESNTEKDTGEASKPDTKEDEPRRIIAVTPKLPPLPELSQSDLYLLYSLMLHGDLTILALAHSLGDAPQVVNNQVQVLRNEDVIEQKDGIVKVNPVHYPKLKRELAKNNFIIEVF